MPDLVILDVMLPRRSGFEVLRQLRAAGARSAVIMLTARDDVIDRVAGLELGADDYVTKPFEPRELVARVGAVLRRVGEPTTEEAGASFFDLRIDTAAREVSRDGMPLNLTRAEFDLLDALVTDRGVVLTRDQLGGSVRRDLRQLRPDDRQPRQEPASQARRATGRRRVRGDASRRGLPSSRA